MKRKELFYKINEEDLRESINKYIDSNKFPEASNLIKQYKKGKFGKNSKNISNLILGTEFKEMIGNKIICYLIHIVSSGILITLWKNEFDFNINDKVGTMNLLIVTFFFIILNIWSKMASDKDLLKHKKRKIALKKLLEN